MSEELAATETPVEEAAPVIETPPVETAPVDEDAALDQQIEDQAIIIPGDEKLVPLSALTSLRDKYKATKGEAARARELQAEIDRIKAEQAENQPWIEAAKTIAATRQLQPQQQQAPAPTGPDPALTAELTELARDLDLYKPDGTADLDKAQRILARQTKVAEQTAAKLVAPVQHHAVQQQASFMLNRAMLTAASDGSKPDPAILRDVFSRLDPRLTATEDGAREAWVAAMGRSAALGKVVWPEGKGPAPKAKDPVPPPLLTEKAGGKDVGNESPITDRERSAAKMMGISEKEYLETAAKRPWRR